MLEGEPHAPEHLHSGCRVSLSGIGRMIQIYSSAARSSEIIVLVVVIAVFGYACVALLRSVENRMGTWRSDLE